MNNIIVERLSLLREVMRREKLSAFIFPSTDAHNGEYVPDHWKSREWVSGFNGSAGTVVVTQNEAALWTDSRYFIAAEEQLQGTGIVLMKLKMPGTPTIPEWLGRKLVCIDSPEVGVDGMVNSINTVEALRFELRRQGGITLRTNFDPLRDIWTDRPAIPQNPVEIHPVEYAGVDTAEKLVQIRKSLARQHADGMLVSSLDDIAWILNLRGSDVHCNPVFLSYLYITMNECLLFADENAMKDINWTEFDNVKLLPYEEIYDFVKTVRGQNIVLDNRIVNTALIEALTENGNTFLFQPNPSEKMKAVKNETELRNIREAHIYDGVAVTKFLFLLKKITGMLF